MSKTSPKGPLAATDAPDVAAFKSGGAAVRAKMRKKSPKGVLELEFADEQSASQSVESVIADLLAWAHGVLKDAGIEPQSAQAARRLARERDHLDVVHWALTVIREADRLQRALGIARMRGEGTLEQATRAADRMWHLASAAYLGRFIEKEPLIFEGMRWDEGRKKKKHDVLA